jgi:hypothetical protein
MKDLLKEAIADAKAVRETALANAKLALEEAFTPRLQSMLSAKLAEEMSDDEDMHEGEEEDYSDATPTFEGEEDEETMDSEEAMDTDAGEEEMPSEEGEEEMPEEDDLDLDEIIKELEMEEDTDSSEIGMGDNKMDDYETSTENDEDLYEEGEDMTDEDDVDINEIIRSLREEDEEEKEEMHEEEETEKSAEELEEAYNVIRFLKGKINEVNLLNAKLLYSNKLFRNFTLNENQKMKVIENFDRAHSLREVKLVYSTLAEGFKMPATKKVVKESFASKPTASTKPAKQQVISEGADLAARFKKLAGLK